MRRHPVPPAAGLGLPVVPIPVEAWMFSVRRENSGQPVHDLPGLLRGDEKAGARHEVPVCGRLPMR